MTDYPVIKMRALKFQTYHGRQEYDYVGKEPPHYTVNVDLVRDDTVFTWAHNAHGAFVHQSYTTKQFHQLFERRTTHE